MVIRIFNNKIVNFLREFLQNFLPVVHIFTRTFNSWPWRFAAGRKTLDSTKILEILTVNASFCRSLPGCKKSNLLFWITLDTSYHFHLKLLKLLLLLFPYHMQKTSFITQLILKIKLTNYLFSLGMSRPNWAHPLEAAK